jgi:hypothetical protein
MNYPITPTPDLVCEWADSYYFGYSETHYGYEQAIAEAAVKWAYEQRQQEIQAAADAELEACCEWMASRPTSERKIPELRAARRPKPLSLKEQALALIDLIQGNEKSWDIRDLDVVRLALETLDD